MLTGPELAKIVTSDGATAQVRPVMDDAPSDVTEMEAFLQQVGDENQVRPSARPHRV